MSDIQSCVDQSIEVEQTELKAMWQLCGQVSEGQTNREFRIRNFPFTIGRDDSASMSVPVSCMSKCHAQIIPDSNGGIVLQDLGSTNGTFVNGKEVYGDTLLKENDIVQFATIPFRIGIVASKKELKTIAEDAGDKALALVQFERLIDDGDLFPHYQPIVKLSDQQPIGYEVLGRSRVFGLQNPREMFAAASQLGCEALLSEKLRRAGVEHGLALGNESNLFVNTHPKELDRRELYSSLKDLRESAPHQAITLEIHEGAVTNLTMMRELCAVLKDLEIKLAFDDFGVGQARLVELGEIRPEYLKFDMNLTKNIDQANSKRQELVALFANLVNSLGIETLAEGVETIECHKTLCEMGFKLGQGFFYGRPVPLSEIIS